MQIIIPMAWLWSRFLEKNYDTPKYLLDLHWKTIIEKIISNFDIENDIFLFICNSNDYKKYNLNKLFKSLWIKFNIIKINNHKLWPWYSIKSAENYINDKLPTIINYCDFFWYWKHNDFVKNIHNKDWIVICYKGFHPHLLKNNLYASVKADKNNNIIDIKEKYCFTKKLTDSYQSSWTYFFKSWEVLKKYNNILIENNITCNWEFYISMIYELMLKDKLHLSVYKIPYFLQLWTPEDYEEYKYFEEYFIK